MTISALGSTFPSLIGGAIWKPKTQPNCDTLTTAHVLNPFLVKNWKTRVDARLELVDRMRGSVLCYVAGVASLDILEAVTCAPRTRLLEVSALKRTPVQHRFQERGPTADAYHKSTSCRPEDSSRACLRFVQRRSGLQCRNVFLNLATPALISRAYDSSQCSIARLSSMPTQKQIIIHYRVLFSAVSTRRASQWIGFSGNPIETTSEIGPGPDGPRTQE